MEVVLLLHLELVRILEDPLAVKRLLDQLHAALNQPHVRCVSNVTAFDLLVEVNQLVVNLRVGVHKVTILRHLGEVGLRSISHVAHALP